MTEDSLPTQRSCGTMVVHERLLRTDPGYMAARTASENRAFELLSRADFTGRVGVTTIPVVVHVVFKTPAQNISDQQIKSQIDVLNADYRKTNADVASTPPAFAPLAADARIQFALATVDPSGAPTTGITRTSTTADSFSDDDSVKLAAAGGADAWPAGRYLNLWVCTLGGGLLGYAQFPGGPAATDGVVVRHTAFGTTGTAAAPFNLGRTTTHEVGHWLNLRHIWGDDGTGCAGSDFVPDTPNAGGPNFGKPTFPQVTCGNGPNGDMFMNFMDYVDDDAMFLFTPGQVARMHVALDADRSSLGTTTTKDPLPGSPVVAGTWKTIVSGHELVYLGGDRVLDWEPGSGAYRIWRYDRNVTSGDPFPGSAVVAGKWSTVGSGHQLIYLDGDRVLDWVPSSGAYRIWRYDRNVTSGDPLPGSPVVAGTWKTIVSGHELVHLGGDRVLDWEPGSGAYRIWRYDRNVTSGDPFPGSAVVAGKWSTVGSGHQLIYLDGDRVLDWVPSSGAYRIWRYDRNVTSGDPLPGSPVVAGTWKTIVSGHELVYLGGDRVLDWEPGSGAYRIWRYDRTITG